MNKTLPILTALFTASAFAQAAPQTLDVYTYDSFSADWSAGPKVKAAFEQQFPQCKLNYVAFDNNGTLFNRVRLEGKKIKADVVLGLDSYQIEDAQKLNIFEPNKVDLSQLRLPIKWERRLRFCIFSKPFITESTITSAITPSVMPRLARLVTKRPKRSALFVRQ